MKARSLNRRSLAVLVAGLLAFMSLACSHMGVAPYSRYRIDERFPERSRTGEILGLEVRSGVPGEALSEANLEKLSTFFVHGLANKAAFPAVIDLTDSEAAGSGSRIVTVEITLFEASNEQQREQRVPSHLHGEMSLRDRASGKALGSATIWATGTWLDLERRSSPDTVRAFTKAMAELLE